MRSNRVKTWMVACVALLIITGLEMNAFDLPEHFEITRAILIGDDPASPPVPPLKVTLDGKEYGFAIDAHDAIQRYNKESDDYITRWNAAFFQPTRHFTDDRFVDSAKALNDRRTEVIRQARRAAERRLEFGPRGGPGMVFYQLQDAAWKNLGEALHAIQDFYSHSNWVELGRPTIVENFSELEIPAATHFRGWGPWRLSEMWPAGHRVRAIPTIFAPATSAEA